MVRRPARAGRSSRARAGTSGVTADAMFAAAATSAAAAAMTGRPSLRRVFRSPANRRWMPIRQLPVSRSAGTASRQSFAISHADTIAARNNGTEGRRA